jgi:hypothetical protein
VKLDSCRAEPQSPRRLQSTLVAAECGLAMVLLVGAGLLIRTFIELNAVNPGMDPHNVLTFELALSNSHYKDQAARAAFYDRFLEKLSAVPGVEAASTVTQPPFAGYNGWGFVTSENPQPPPDSEPDASYQVIAPDYFKAMGIPLEQMVLWNPFKPYGGLTDDEIKNAKIILWRGHCSVHQQFRPEHADTWRKHHPDVNIIVHPECMMQVVDKADFVGSTSYIVKKIDQAPAGSKWAVGTEMHLVNRLKNKYTDKMVELLSPFSCLCSTMYRISPIDLANVMENLVEGRVINQITVPENIKHNAKLSLDRMLSIPK